MGASPFLPILTFDPGSLTPSLGYLFDKRWIDPFESVVSILWKFTRVNGIAGYALAVRLCAKDAIDPYAGLAPFAETVDLRWLHHEFRIPRRIVHEALLSSSRQRALHPHLQFCARCLTRGYHSTVHQFACVARCPIHDIPLRSTCRHCNEPTPFRLNALLLDAPFSCAHCRAPLGAVRPSITRHVPMSMPDRIRITRYRLGRRLY